MTDTPDFQALAHETIEMFPGARNSRMRRERLTRLVDMLVRLRPTKTRHFHLAEWETQKRCGTAACALGYAMVHPWFNARGFHRVISETGNAIPKFRGARGWFAAEQFFCASFGAAVALFDEDGYAPRQSGNPKAVAARIRAFLAALDDVRSTKRAA